MTPPKRLKGDARKKWLELFSDQQGRSALDIEAACQYCECWADYISARKDVAERGQVVTAGKNGAPYCNPAIGVANKALDQMRRLSDRLTVKKPKDTAKADDFSDL